MTHAHSHTVSPVAFSAFEISDLFRISVFGFRILLPGLFRISIFGFRI
jgi:hypothetical protein